MLFKKGKGHDSLVIQEPKHLSLGTKQHKSLKERLFADKTKGQIAWSIFKLIFAPRNWKLIIILFPLFMTTTRLLREDHIKMTELREAVISADRTENDIMINETLTNLRDFVFNNIVINIVDDNGEKKITFGTGPFYLEHMYTRAASEALFKASNSFASDDNPNGNIYQEASNICKERAIKNGWTWDNPNFINCMVDEINKYPAAEEIQDKLIASIPSTALYRKNYASPAWAPTKTGFCILAMILIIVVIFIRTIVWIISGIALLFV